MSENRPSEVIEVKVKRYPFVVSKHEYAAAGEGEKGSEGNGEGNGESGGEGSEGGGNT